MLVKFLSTWFAPSETVVVDKIRKVSGQRFRKGVHEVPDELKGFLPSTAKVVKEKEEPVKETVESTDLKDYDGERKAMDEFVAKAEKAEEAAKSLKEQRQERMAKAREVYRKQKEAVAEKVQES